MTIGQVRGWAFGLLHLPKSEFYQMRPGEFWEAMDAYSREQEANRRHIGELARGAALRLFNVLVAPQSRISDPAQFWVMPWDDVATDEGLERLQGLTEDERAAEAREFIKRIGW